MPRILAVFCTRRRTSSMSWTDLGGRCLDLGPLDQEIWEYLGFDCFWVLELQVSRAELDVPLGDSIGRSGVVEDDHEWCAAYDRDANRSSATLSLRSL